MPPLTPAALRKQIASADTGPLYLLLGEDDAEKAAVAGEFAETVEEGLRAFNVDRLYGAESTVDDLTQTAATLPMMAPRRIVLVLAAEGLLIPKRESKAAEDDQERLERFIQAPPAHATVVFVCGPLDMRRRVVKLLVKEAQVVDCGTIGDEADAERWVKTRAARLGAPLDAGAVRALVRRAGADLARLRAGLDRLALYAMGQPAITAEDVRQAVPAGPEAQAEWGIAKAISRNDAAEALHELHLTLDAGAQPVFVLGQLRTAAERLPPSRVRHGIDAVFRTDLALKSSGGEPRVLLERLVVELCERRRR
ncbi:MAG: DNA polymerase III subunit delta [Acidobacteria bacterium RIFCSPLOWO2_02_FULL_68_18]|nr:MAG: DNA polymerase III subunit delta [Acidobacteria bacterium RIFCSPLOWO2_02_FULL_68_18]OFW49990.1 MAG: DNA polymerase III subunit delta [Acidobacteria bacterium RIFCSPLOWO2_12_FULL_68_19]